MHRFSRRKKFSCLNRSGSEQSLTKPNELTELAELINRLFNWVLIAAVLNHLAARWQPIGRILSRFLILEQTFSQLSIR